MKNLTIMLKPASGLCNLRCRYCFYADVTKTRETPSFGVMSEQTMLALLENVRRDLTAGDRITFAFQGGEPCMAGLSWFRSFTAVTGQWKDLTVRYCLQTNATLLDEAWCAFLKQYQFLVGVSWDVLPECHDAVRVDTRGQGTSHRVLESIALLEKWGIDFNILCTLTRFVARHPEKVWKNLIRHNIRYVQFTPCLGELDGSDESGCALTPERFAGFYNRIFELWYEDFAKGQYRSVKLIDDVVNLLAHGIPTACGMGGQCSPQLVVEADGSTYPCDFYCLEDYCLGNLSRQSLQEVFESPRMRQFALRPHSAPEKCRECEFARFCGGGCKRMQSVMCCSGEEKFCGYREFLRGNMDALTRIARVQLR